jgi:hypothetical protein
VGAEKAHVHLEAAVIKRHAFDLYSLLRSRAVVPNLPWTGHGVTLRDDWGPTFQEFGNASGGSYPGYYRTFVVDHGGVPRSAPRPRIHFGLFSVPYEGHVRTGNCKTSLIVAVSDGRRHHNSLQLWVEKYWRRCPDFVEVIHNGRLAFGKGGSIPRDTVFASVARYAPTLVRDGQVYLGRFPASRALFRGGRGPSPLAV